ncbi:MAG: Tat pathway signal protein [Clostridia bacterium]|nr:Tat pathway signal protein [Clostridia bacterium]
MKHDMMWAYLIHLSDNMWGDTPETNPTPFHPTLELDEATWRQVLDFLPTRGFNTVVVDVGDAVQYESHPEIAIPGAWSKDKLKAELDYMRSIGLTPIPKLNFSACHDAWMGEYSRMLSTTPYYKVCKDLILETAELFGNPEYFHLGMDEETAEHQRTFQYATMRQGDLWWHDIYHLFDCCDKAGTRPWVWSDPCWAHRGHQEEYLKRMPKSVLQSNWSYHRIAKNADGTPADPAYQAYIDLDKAGFEQVPTSSTWSIPENSEETMELVKKFCSPALVKGFMTAPWKFTYSSELYDLLGDAHRFGLAKEKLYPEQCK